MWTRVIQKKYEFWRFICDALKSFKASKTKCLPKNFRKIDDAFDPNVTFHSQEVEKNYMNALMMWYQKNDDRFLFRNVKLLRKTQI